jgi:two-component system chemotaxis response regulator CheY
MEKRVVVVEDFNTSRQIIKRTLESLGFIVYEATYGRDALRFFDGRKIDMVVSDFNMPNMNGAELVTYIRSMNEYKYLFSCFPLIQALKNKTWPKMRKLPVG